MPKHALLSASASKQWLNCPPSAKLCAEQEDRASPYAQQGTDAHELCEYKVLSALGKSERDPTENLEFYDAENNAAAMNEFILNGNEFSTGEKIEAFFNFFAIFNAF